MEISKGRHVVSIRQPVSAARHGSNPSREGCSPSRERCQDPETGSLFEDSEEEDGSGWEIKSQRWKRRGGRIVVGRVKITSDKEQKSQRKF